MSQTLMVTGPGGYIGSALCALLESAGLNLVRAPRGEPPAGGYASDSVRPIDLHSSDFPDSLFAGVDCVVHLAGVAHRSAPQKLIEQVNYRSTLALAEAAARAGVLHFVFLSSIHAERVDDNDDPRGAPYAVYKRRAERALLEYRTADPIRVSVIRPALVYGGPMKGRLATLQRLAASGWLPRLPDAGALRMIAREDLAALIAAVCAPELQHSGMVTAHDGEAYSLRRISDAFRNAAGCPSRLPMAALVGSLCLTGVSILRAVPWMRNRLPFADGINVDLERGGDCRFPETFKPSWQLESALTDDRLRGQR